MSLSLTEMNKEDMIEILRGFDSIDTNLGARLAWDAFTLGDDAHVGLLETSDDEDLVSWDKLPRNILARAIREGELIFKEAVGIGGEEIDDDLDVVETDEEGDMTFTPAIEALDGLGDEDDEELDVELDESSEDEDDEELDIDEADIVAALQEVGIGGQDIVEVADEELDEELDEIEDESSEDKDDEEII